MSVSIVDIAPFGAGGNDDQQAVADAFDDACRKTGFLVVTGHGVVENIQNELRQAGREFFDRPLEEKLHIRRTRHEQNRGYIPYGEECLVRMHGGDSPPDYKEVFAIGPCQVPDEAYFTADAGYPNFAPNVWPDAPAHLRPAMEAYYRAMEELTLLIARICTVALELPPDWFEDKLDRHTSHLRLLHYPVPDGAFEPGQLRCGEHTDLGAITILLNEAAPGGLEVRSRDGRWVEAPAIPDSFVVNIGDLMMRWTNDRWTSTPHRVAVPPAAVRARSRRLSIAYFVRPNYDAEIACIPSCHDPRQPARYPPTTLAEYSVSRFAAGAGPQATA